eukprot:COSAG06_NODE_851_length_11957_cov_6.770048_12_plen_46_part_00
MTAAAWPLSMGMVVEQTVPVRAQVEACTGLVSAAGLGMTAVCIAS